MYEIALVARLRRRVVVAAIVIMSLATALLGTTSLGLEATAVVGILHPMQPIGNIDCCH